MRVFFSLVLIWRCLLGGCHASAGSDLDLKINEFMALNQTTLLDPDFINFGDWIELQNHGVEPLNLTGFGLTDDLTRPFKWRIPVGSDLAGGGRILFWADGADTLRHTSFRLKGAGETIGLFSSQGALLDSVTFGPQVPDVSYARPADAPETWRYLADATPGELNAGGGLTDSTRCAFPTFTPVLDFAAPLQLVEIASDQQGALLYYTLDGSLPTSASMEYVGAFTVDTTAVVRARAYATGLLPSAVRSQTYFVAENSTLPLISLAAPREYLWDAEHGIYVMEDLERRREWERPASLEFYAPQGELLCAEGVGLRLFGRTAIFLPQKSLAVFARDVYESEQISYPIFPQRSIDGYASIVMRSGSDDWPHTMLRDAFGHVTIAGRLPLAYQAYRPTIAFINGQYCGIHNVREKYNGDYLAAHEGVDPDSVDYLWVTIDEVEVLQGSADHFVALREFIESHDLGDPTNFAYVKTQMDVENYLDYLMVQLYAANISWGHNIKVWRPQDPSGRWRWLPYDLDKGYFYQADETVARAQEECPFFAQMIENEGFWQRLVQRLAGHLSTTYTADRMSGMFDSLAAQITAEMPRHIERWGPSGGIPSMAYWEEQLEETREFLDLRSNYVVADLETHFGLEPAVSLSVSVFPPGAGTIEIAGVSLTDSSLSALYFTQVPMEVIAKPDRGQRFRQWMGASVATADTISLLLDTDATLNAYFESDPCYDVQINEINYNSADTFDPEDWIELHNHALEHVDVGGWVFRDEDPSHEFILPPMTSIAPGCFLVLCRDSLAFRTHFPDVPHVLGEFDFGLSGGGEWVCLYSAVGVLIDSLTYDDDAPWPAEPDGTGPTLELLHPALDNGLSTSWAASVGHGTPGLGNSVASAGDTMGGEQTRIILMHHGTQPNPSCGLVSVHYALRVPAVVQLKVYDVSGRCLRTLSQRARDRSGSLRWDGTDESGQWVAGGIYCYRLRVRGDVGTGRFLILR